MTKEVYVSSRTRAFSNPEEARRSGYGNVENAILNRAYDLQLRYGTASTSREGATSEQRRLNARIARAAINMLSRR